MNPAPATVIDVMVMVRSLPIPPVEDSGIGQRGLHKARKIAKVIEEGLKARHQTKSKEQKPAG